MSTIEEVDVGFHAVGIVALHYLGDLHEYFLEGGEVKLSIHVDRIFFDAQLHDASLVVELIRYDLVQVNCRTHDFWVVRIAELLVIRNCENDTVLTSAERERIVT